MSLLDGALHPDDVRGGACSTQGARLRERIDARGEDLRKRIDAQSEQMGLLRERMAHLEGPLDGPREAIAGKRVA